eukprot:2445-Heterococcus_DN1.PRE.1
MWLYTGPVLSTAYTARCSCAVYRILHLYITEIRVPVPRRIRFGRPLDTQTDNDEYLLTLGMMLGLRVAVGRQENPLERPELSVQDFYQCWSGAHLLPARAGMSAVYIAWSIDRSCACAATAVDDINGTGSSCAHSMAALPHCVRQPNLLNTAALSLCYGSSCVEQLSICNSHNSHYTCNYCTTTANTCITAAAVHCCAAQDYAPKVFKRIREHFGVDRLQYMLSVAGNYNFLDFITNAKSGQFFFYSHDERFMIKVGTYTVAACTVSAL